MAKLTLVTTIGELVSPTSGMETALKLSNRIGMPGIPVGRLKVLVTVIWSDLTSKVQTMGMPQTNKGPVLSLKEIMLVPEPFTGRSGNWVVRCVRMAPGVAVEIVAWTLDAPREPLL